MKVELSGKSSGGGASHKVYTCIVSQTGGSAPTQIILENTMGITLTWSFVGGGSYRATSSVALDLTKTFIYSAKNMISMEHSIGVRTQNATTFEFGIETLGGGGSNDELHNTLFNIISYE